MGVLISTLGKVGMSVLWAFLGEAILGKLVFGLLRYLASKTSNELDDEIVDEAYARFKGGADGKSK